MLCMLVFYLLTRTLTDHSSVMLDGGSVQSVVWVVLVKGMSWNGDVAERDVRLGGYYLVEGDDEGQRGFVCRDFQSV